MEVNIDVNRNPNAPVFSQPTYNVAISEGFTPGEIIFPISATDADGVSTKIHK